MIAGNANRVAISRNNQMRFTREQFQDYDHLLFDPAAVGKKVDCRLR